MDENEKYGGTGGAPEEPAPAAKPEAPEREGLIERAEPPAAAPPPLRAAPSGEALIYEDRWEIKKGYREISKYLIYALAFAIPFLLMMLAFANIEMFPFGKIFGFFSKLLHIKSLDRRAVNQIMVIDSWHQYYPFLSELQTKLRSLFSGSTSLMYSWNTGAGTNFLVLMSYYATSPLYLFSVLFPKEYLREFMALATLVKIGLSGLFFAMYLKNLYKRSDVSIVAFSVLYALSAFAVGYYWCIMWLDCMALLPLVILGLHKLLDENKFLLYVLALALTVFSNYYIGYFVCEFTALYYLVLYVSKFSGEKKYHFIKTTGKTLFYSGLGVLLSSFMLLPTYTGLKLTANSLSTPPQATSVYNSLLDILTGLFTGRAPAIRAGLPNIACGMLTILLCILYFSCGKIKLREKLAHGALLLFLLFSFNINQLDYIWHGFHFPNEIPYRYAFVFSFVLVHMAYKAFVNIEDWSVRIVGAAAGGLAAYILAAERIYKDSQYFGFAVFYLSLLLVIWYAMILLLFKYRRLTIAAASAFIILAACVEGAIAAFTGASTTGFSGRSDYAPQKENIQAVVKDIYGADDGMYRLEMRNWYSTNDPVIYGYRGVSQFSSEANSNFSRMLEILGIASDVGSNRYLYSTATPVINAMLSMKYIMTRTGFPETQLFDKVYEEGAVQAYENKYWLPMGFVAKDDILNWIDLANIKNINKNTFLVQNSFMNCAAGVIGDVFTMINPEPGVESNLSASRSVYGEYYFRQTNTSLKSNYTQKYVSDKDQHVYLYVKSPRCKNAAVTVNGNQEKYESERGVTVDCGYLKAGQEVSVYLEYDPGDNGNFYIYAAGFNEDLCAQGYDKLLAGGLNVTRFTDTSIEGSFTADGLGTLFMSVPYEKGWSAKVDGESVAIESIGNGFIGVPVTGGTHTVKLSYVTEGLIPGAVISLICLAVLIFLLIARRLGLYEKLREQIHKNS